MKKIKFSDLKKADIVLAYCHYCQNWHSLYWKERTLIMNCDMPYGSYRYQMLFDFSDQCNFVNELCITINSPLPKYYLMVPVYSRKNVIPFSQFKITSHRNEILLETLFPEFIWSIPIKLKFLKKQ